MPTPGPSSPSILIHLVWNGSLTLMFVCLFVLNSPGGANVPLGLAATALFHTRNRGIGFLAQLCHFLFYGRVH